MSHPTPPTFTLTIRPQPSATPAAVRLRAWLKVGLRRFGLKALRVEGPSTADTPQLPPPPAGPGPGPGGAAGAGRGTGPPYRPDPGICDKVGMSPRILPTGEATRRPAPLPRRSPPMNGTNGTAHAR